MTYDDLTEVAKREGLVRWEASGIIEYLRITKTGALIARTFKGSHTHPIRKRDAVGNEFEAYRCVEITRDEALRLRAATEGTAA